MMAKELDIPVEELSWMGGECNELRGRIPDLVIQCLSYLLSKQKDDPEAAALLERLNKG